jgi:lysophospholipase L1-like esterase
MKINFIFLFISGILTACSSESMAQFKPINPSDDRIQVIGANYVFRKDGLLSFSRFSQETLNSPMKEAMFNADKARTTSGIKLLFKTNSSTVKLTFSPQPGINRGSEFAVLQNGQICHTPTFKGEAGNQNMAFEIENQYPGKETVFEIVLPSLSNVALSGFEMDDNAELFDIDIPEKPVYLALGNSITHGVGQGSASYLTYPYLLAKKLNVNCYSLAVGGAKISPAIARMTAELPQANLITILIGYNDLMFNNKSVEQFKQDYIAYLNEIRKNQPKAHIYCITLTYTRATKNAKTGITPNDFRNALKELITSLQVQDDLLYLVEGDKITSEANLREDVPTDLTHLGVEGAALFADELYGIIGNNARNNH